MKKSDKYPSASEEDLKNLPLQMHFLGLHPLVWVALVVLVIAGGRACDTVADLGCAWKWWVKDTPPHSEFMSVDGLKETN